MHLFNSVSDELAIIYLARGLQLGKSNTEETEQLQLRKMPFQEAFGLVLSGEITDSMSVAAILKVKLMFEQKELA